MPAATARRAARLPPLAFALSPETAAWAPAGSPLKTIDVIALTPVTTGCVTLSGTFNSCARNAASTVGVATVWPRNSCCVAEKEKLPASFRRCLATGEPSLPRVSRRRARRAARRVHPALGGSPQKARFTASWAFSDDTVPVVEKETAEVWAMVTTTLPPGVELTVLSSVSKSESVPTPFSAAGSISILNSTLN